MKLAHKGGAGVKRLAAPAAWAAPLLLLSRLQLFLLLPVPLLQRCLQLWLLFLLLPLPLPQRRLRLLQLLVLLQLLLGLHIVLLQKPR